MSIDFDAHVAAESATFLAAVEAAGPTARVPSCPDWDVADLLWHLATVQHFWAVDVAERRRAMDDHVEPERPTSFDAQLTFFRDASRRLVDALAAAPDDGEPVWSWFEADQTIGFVRRRQAHEALIHRIDAELAAGAVSAIDRDLATDGVLEAIEWQFGGPPSWATVDESGPVGSVATTDTGHRWLVQRWSWHGTSPNTGRTYRGEPVLAVVDAGTPTFGVSGQADELDRWIWNRGPGDRLTIDGDAVPLLEVVRLGVD